MQDSGAPLVWMPLMCREGKQTSSKSIKDQVNAAGTPVLGAAELSLPGFPDSSHSQVFAELPGIPPGTSSESQHINVLVSPDKQVPNQKLQLSSPF